MEDIDSFWNFQENVDDLKQRLQYTTYELEITRKETNEEIKKSNDQIKKLLQLLQTTCKERDEAKSQLKKLQQIMSFNNNKPINLIENLHQFNPSPITTTTTTTTAPFSPDSPLLTAHFPTKTNSSLTESSSFSLETQNNNNNNNNSTNYTQSHVSSPDSSNNVFSTTNNTTTTTSTETPVVMGSTTLKPTTIDQESLVIANLAKGRPLPQKGKLLQAVLEAGPLLSTLMVAGSLPQWRNPPGVLTHQIPPVNLKGCGVMINQSPGCNKFYTSQMLSQPSNLPLQSINDVGVMSHNNNNNNNVTTMYNGQGVNSSGSFGVCPSPLLDFGSGSLGSCYMGGRIMMNSGVSFECQIPKRQRIL